MRSFSIFNTGNLLTKTNKKLLWHGGELQMVWHKMPQ